MIDLTRADILIHSGEGEEGSFERYFGARSVKAIRSKLSRSRAGGRWAFAWIIQHGTVYGRLSSDFASIDDERDLSETRIRINPAALLASGHKRPMSAANGRRHVKRPPEPE